MIWNSEYGAQPKRSEPFGKAVREEFGRNDGADVEDDRHQQEHAGHARQRGDETFDHTAQARRHRDDTQNPQDPQRPKHRKPLSRRHQRNPDDNKVEDVPAIGKETEPIGDQLQQDLNHEDRKADLVEQCDQSADTFHQRAGRLNPQQHRVDKDHDGDETSKPRMFQEFLQAYGHVGRS